MTEQYKGMKYVVKVLPQANDTFRWQFVSAVHVEHARMDFAVFTAAQEAGRLAAHQYIDTQVK